MPSANEVKKKRVFISRQVTEKEYIGGFSDQTMQLHVFNQWVDKLNSDGVFSESDYKGNFNGDDCIVSEDNTLEILEALEINDYITEDEAIDLIQ